MSDWSEELSEWLKPFLARLGHKARRRMCPLYVAGLIGPGDRKSVGPMAERLAPGDYDQLHHFVSSGVWDAAPLEEELARQADALVGGPDAVLVIDDTSLPKKGQHSVGVAPQYASALGKTSNCQSLVSVTLASREVPVMMGLRLFLPEIWTDDPGRMTRARVPKDRQVALTKLEIAIEEIDRVVASGARFGCVLADAGYGSSGTFRQALSERGLLWAVGLSRRQNVYPADVALIFPVAKTGKLANITSPITRRSLPTPCWRVRDGRRSAGDGAPEVGWQASLRLAVSVLRTPISTGCSTIACNACRATRSGLSASGDRPGSRSTMYPTCQPRPRSRGSRPPSRRGGSASRRISNSRRNSASTISKADPGPDYTDMP